ncbi:MAG: signal peptidase II [Actinomycetota bacterium]
MFGRPLLVAAAVVVVDQLTKWWALRTLAGGSCDNPDACIDLIAGARFRLVYNYGAAFSSGSDYGPIFGVLAFFMTFLLLYLAAGQPRLGGQVAFAAIAGGAVGNLLDRAFRAEDGFLSGAVIDFVDLGWWPVFNFADSAIVVGVASIVLLTALTPEEPEHPDPTAGGPTADDPDRSAEGPTDEEPAEESGHEPEAGRRGMSDREAPEHAGESDEPPSVTSGVGGPAPDRD